MKWRKWSSKRWRAHWKKNSQRKDGRRLWGFYSETAACNWGTIWWTTLNGKKVEVTAVWPNPEGSGYGWQDKKCVGEVVEHAYGSIRCPGLRWAI